MKKLLFSVMVTGILIAALTGCGNFGEIAGNGIVAEGTGIRIQLPGNDLARGNPMLTDVDFYSICVFRQPGGELIEETTGSLGEEILIEDLIEGSYSVILLGMSGSADDPANANVLFQGHKDVDVWNGYITEALVIMRHVDGDIALQVQYPVSAYPISENSVIVQVGAETYSFPFEGTLSCTLQEEYDFYVYRAFSSSLDQEPALQVIDFSFRSESFLDSETLLLSTLSHQDFLEPATSMVFGRNPLAAPEQGYQDLVLAGPQYGTAFECKVYRDWDGIVVTYTGGGIAVKGPMMPTPEEIESAPLNVFSVAFKITNEKFQL